MQKLSSPVKLIGDSFKIFFAKENLVYFISIYLVMIPFQIFTYFKESIFGSGSSNLETGPYAGIILAINILYFIAYLLTSAAGILAVKKVVDKEQVDFKDTMILAWRNLWGFFLLSVLLFLITLGGSILLIIPGIIFSVWFSFARFVFIDQNLGIRASLSKSRELIKNRFWPVLGRLIVIGLFFGIISGVVTYLSISLSLISSVLLSLTGAFFILPYYLLYKELSAQ